MNKTTDKSVVIRNMTFQYEEASEESLRRFHLEVNTGELVVLTGPSGCGKTTVTRCINGLIPDFFDGHLEGEIVIEGQSASSLSIKERSRIIGSVFQDPRTQFFTLDVLSEIAFPGENMGISTPDLRQNVKQAVSDLEIGPLMDRRIFHLSSGERQKVAIASVYATAPHIFVLDEPSANLDGFGTEQLRRILIVLKKRGYTIIISEHKLHYLKDLADRVVVMKSGMNDREWSGPEFFNQPDERLSEHNMRSICLDSMTARAPGSCFKAETPPLLEARELSFYYRKKNPVLKKISFKAFSGEVVGLIGKNGVGKSTLIRILMGLKDPKSGCVLLKGRACSRKKRVKKSFYVMQEVDYQLFSATVEEEMFLGLPPSPENRDKVFSALQYFDLETMTDRHPSSLSGGEKQRLAIALSCLCEAEILFFDEPTSGLDSENMMKVSSLLRSLAGEGLLVFVISHDYEFMLNTFDRILYMEAGDNISSLEMCDETLDTLKKIFDIKTYSEKELSYYEQ